MGKLSISEAWEQTKAILARDGRILTAVGLALIVLPELVLSVSGVPIGPDANSLTRIVYIAVILLGFVAQIALNRLAIGPSVSVREAIGQGFARLVPVFIVFLMVVIGLVVVTALLAFALSRTGMMALPAANQAPPASFILLLMLLMALVFAIFQLVFPLSAIETGNPIRLIARSWQLARGDYLRLLGFVATIFVGLGLAVVVSQMGLGTVIVLLLGRPNPGTVSALIVGLVAGIIQATFTIVTAVMLARIYVQLAGRDGTPDLFR